LAYPTVRDSETARQAQTPNGVTTYDVLLALGARRRGFVLGCLRLGVWG
jgi:hypothetical protein